MILALLVLVLGVITGGLVWAFGIGQPPDAGPDWMAAPAPPWPPVRTDPDAAGAYDPVLPPPAEVPDGVSVPNIPPPYPWCKPHPTIPNAWYCNGQPDQPPEEHWTAATEENIRKANSNSDIFLRHYDELAHIPGFAGGGVDADGIVIRVTEPHGEFPPVLEGVPTHLAPKIQAWSLGDPLPWEKK